MARRLLTVQVDVTVGDQLDHAMDEVRRRFGRLDVLFVNAGIGEFVPVTEASS